MKSPLSIQEHFPHYLFSILPCRKTHSVVRELWDARENLLKKTLIHIIGSVGSSCRLRRENVSEYRTISYLTSQPYTFDIPIVVFRLFEAIFRHVGNCFAGFLLFLELMLLLVTCWWLADAGFLALELIGAPDTVSVPDVLFIAAVDHAVGNILLAAALLLCVPAVVCPCCCWRPHYCTVCIAPDYPF